MDFKRHSREGGQAWLHVTFEIASDVGFNVADVVFTGVWRLNKSLVTVFQLLFPGDEPANAIFMASRWQFNFRVSHKPGFFFNTFLKRGCLLNCAIDEVNSRR